MLSRQPYKPRYICGREVISDNEYNITQVIIMRNITQEVVPNNYKNEGKRASKPPHAATHQVLALASQNHILHHSRHFGAQVSHQTLLVYGGCDVCNPLGEELGEEGAVQDRACFGEVLASL